MAQLMSYIDEVMIFDSPWMKPKEGNGQGNGQMLGQFSDELRQKHFDACVIFTVCSQSALPAAMLAWEANIPKRLAYCRENPYHLLTDWIPDKEPYELIKHQVERDMDLVKWIGAPAATTAIEINLDRYVISSAFRKLKQEGLDKSKPFLVLHTGVSEEKREYPTHLWIELGKLLSQKDLQLVFTGSDAEQDKCSAVCKQVGTGVFNLSGKLDLAEFAAVLSLSSLVVTVNTCTVHLASALQKPVVVLQARTNPQHTPWMTPNKVLDFSIDDRLKSKNSILNYIDHRYYADFKDFPTAEQIYNSIIELSFVNANSLSVVF